MQVRALEGAWQAVLDGVLRRRGSPTTDDYERLGESVAELSRAYNLDGVERPHVPLDARIGFSFVRDVPKGAAAVRELLASGAITPGQSLRILDLGAGLGAMTWGIARAVQGNVEALLVDDDTAALGAAQAIADEASRAGLSAGLTITTRSGKLGTANAGAFDLVVLGQVLSEVDRSMDPELRADKHAGMIAELLAKNVAETGSLVVVEPALRDRTRHLHLVRDRLVAKGIVPFAPCLHAKACPALTIDNEWCHEDLDVDLPSWLVPVAREAGLRWQGLTFSYLVVRRDKRSLRDELSRDPGLVHLRAISKRIETKGKVEIFACTAEGERIRMRLIDRERTDASAPWGELSRGDVVTLRGENEPGVDDRGRLSKTAEVDVWRGKN